MRQPVLANVARVALLAITVLGVGCAHLAGAPPHPGSSTPVGNGTATEGPTHKVLCNCACLGLRYTFDVPPSECKQLRGAACHRGEMEGTLGDCHLEAVPIE